MLCMPLMKEIDAATTDTAAKELPTQYSCVVWRHVCPLTDNRLSSNHSSSVLKVCIMTHATHGGGDPPNLLMGLPTQGGLHLTRLNQRDQGIKVSRYQETNERVSPQ